MKIFVTGGCGYKGSVLVPKLLTAGHEVTVADTMWFGNHLQDHVNLTVKKLDVRKIGKKDLSDHTTIIHLASVANDPTGDLNPELTWEISALATMQLLDTASRVGIKQFVYASSGSVYGVKDEERVVEDLSLEPISVYNKTKMISERVALSYQSNMDVSILRPATVCGVSERMRLDVVVNLLTIQALKNGKMTVLGGDQVRPNVHIQDITDLYCKIVENPKTYNGVFNVGFENMSVLDIAKLIKTKLDAEIEIKASNDPRSYRIDSEKLKKTGFKPNYTVSDAIDEIIVRFQRGELKDEVQWYNLNWMKHTNAHTSG